ncbi:hypothetical protein [Neisseria musculi]|uniref:Uncharacterized protein n=1 Tax=Neisseria musculi TaxID=1815583 RepID=A0A7H1M7W2_9NEIS|nr:hypothetical protein [Neisseria musculi]QNT57727.1 hypothetical protein H7A79_1142 [Neisseria musculi]
MNAKDLIEWFEDRGEMVISKSDGGNFVVVARKPDGMMKSAEAATLERAIALWEES